jgi:hypothetical protein
MAFDMINAEDLKIRHDNGLGVHTGTTPSTTTPHGMPHDTARDDNECTDTGTTTDLASTQFLAETFINCNFLRWLAAIDGEDRTVNKQITACF